MRPLYHPPLKEITVQGILFALSDPARVRIFYDLASASCSKSCTNLSKTEDHPIPKSTLSQHFRILREAGLIRSVRKGVELQNEARCAELDKKFGSMIGSILEAYHKEAR
jgi:DNA-binding transcriptional ArsR family regulator